MTNLYSSVLLIVFYKKHSNARKVELMLNKFFAPSSLKLQSVLYVSLKRDFSSVVYFGHNNKVGTFYSMECVSAAPQYFKYIQVR